MDELQSQHTQANNMHFYFPNWPDHMMLWRSGPTCLRYNNTLPALTVYFAGYILILEDIDEFECHKLSAGKLFTRGGSGLGISSIKWNAQKVSHHLSSCAVF